LDVPELPPLPAPPSAALLAPFQAAAEQAAAGPERARALARSAELRLAGAAALPAQRATHEPTPGPAHAALETTLVELASVVATVDVGQAPGTGAAAGSPLAEAAAALVGEPLAASDVIDLLRLFLHERGS